MRKKVSILSLAIVALFLSIFTIKPVRANTVFTYDVSIVGEEEKETVKIAINFNEAIDVLSVGADSFEIMEVDEDNNETAQIINFFEFEDNNKILNVYVPKSEANISYLLKQIKDIAFEDGSVINSDTTSYLFEEIENGVIENIELQAVEEVIKPKVVEQRKFFLVAKTYETGQRVVELHIEMEFPVDPSSINTETFEVLSTGINPINADNNIDSDGTCANVQAGGNGMCSSVDYKDSPRNITDVSISDDHKTVILYLDERDEGAITLTYIVERLEGNITTQSRNHELDLEYVVKQNSPFSLKSGEIIFDEYEYVDSKIIRDHEVDRFSDGEYGGIKYRLANPEVINHEKQPLVIWFHGNGEGGYQETSNNSTQLIANRGGLSFASDHQETLGYPYVLAPQAPDTWYNNYHKGYIDTMTAMIENIIENNPHIDEHRIYITGGSAGGYMAVRMMIENPELFAAAILAAPATDLAANQSKGNFGTVTTEAEILTLKDIPIWWIHSNQDTTVLSKDTSEWMYNTLALYDNKIYTEFGDISADYGVSYAHASWELLSRNIPEKNGVSVIEWLGKQTKTIEDEPVAPIIPEEIEKIPTPNTGIHVDVQLYLSFIIISIASIFILRKVKQ